VMRVTFSDGWMRRQVVTALRAPGEYVSGKGTRRRSSMGGGGVAATALGVAGGAAAASVSVPLPISGPTVLIASPVVSLA
jgi:hypothetical protein